MSILNDRPPRVKPLTCGWAAVRTCAVALADGLEGNG